MAKKRAFQTSLRDVHYIPSHAPWVETHGYCVLFNSEKEDWEHDVTRNLLMEPSGSQTHPVTLAGGR